MIEKHFSNKMCENAIEKINDDRKFYIKEATEKADFDAIVKIAELNYIEALIDSEVFQTYESYFKQVLSHVTPRYIRLGDYDFINKATVKFTEYTEAADFLTCCKLFVKWSSDYELIVDNGTYAFNFNIDRVDGEYL